MRMLALLLLGCSPHGICDTHEGGTPMLARTSGDCPDPPAVYFAVVNAGGDAPYHLQLSPNCLATIDGCVVNATCQDGAKIHSENGRITLKTPSCAAEYSVTYR